MILDIERIIQASSVSIDKGIVEIELEGIEPELGENKGNMVVFVAMMTDSLTLVVGVIGEYEEQKTDPDLRPELEAISKVRIHGYAVSVSI